MYYRTQPTDRISNIRVSLNTSHHITSRMQITDENFLAFFSFFISRWLELPSLSAPFPARPLSSLPLSPFPSPSPSPSLAKPSQALSLIYMHIYAAIPCHAMLCHAVLPTPSKKKPPCIFSYSSSSSSSLCFVPFRFFFISPCFFQKDTKDKTTQDRCKAKNNKTKARSCTVKNPCLSRPPPCSIVFCVLP